MPRFRLTAAVTVDVVMEIEADSVADARALFDRSVVATVGLVDVSPETWSVDEDSISGIDDIVVVAV